MSFEFTIAILLIGAFILTGLIIAVARKYYSSGTLRIIKAGKTFDNYRIIKPIKRGGMATIYHAIDVKMKRPVALKIMHENLLDDEDLITKFLYEGDILERLNRKYANAPIVQVFRHSRESNDIHGRPFIALEYIDGEDLDDLIRKGQKFTIEEVLKIIHATGVALSAAHKEGIWHRDVSPGNIIVRYNNGSLQDIRVIDFGVAKHEYIGKQTPDGSIHGKPPFMSPEQCRNESIDARSDIYSLGILFYTLVHGQPPFMSRNPLEIMKMHETSPVPELPDSLPLNIRNIIYKMLQKKTEDRYENLDVMLNEIEIIMQSIPQVEYSEQTIDVGVDEQEKEDGDKEPVPVIAGVQKKSNIAVKVLVTGIVVLVLLSVIFAYYIMNQPETPLIIDQGPIEFFNIIVNEQSSETRSIENTKNYPVYINEISLSGLLPDVFSVNVNTPIIIDPGESFTIPVQFIPRTAGDHEATLLIDIDDGDLQSFSIPLYGKAIADVSIPELIPDIEFPERFNFTQNVRIGEQRNGLVSVKNTGNKEYDIISIELQGYGASSFSVASPFPVTIPPGMNEEIQILFRPTTSGRKTASLVLHTSDDVIGSPVVEMVGSAIDPTKPIIIADIDISFPGTPEGGESRVISKVKNTGDGNLELKSLSIEGTDRGEFRISSDHPETIPPNDERDIEIIFSPLTRGEQKYATLVIQSNDPENEYLSVSLSGSVYEIDIYRDLNLYFEEAVKLFQEGRFQQAERAFAEIITQDRRYANAYYMRGRSLIELKEWRKAVEVFDELIPYLNMIPSEDRYNINCERLYYASLAVSQEWVGLMQSRETVRREQLRSQAEGRWLDYKGLCKEGQPRHRINDADYWLNELTKD